jgi:uncharacterized protein YjbI with pentapeptide repeats
MSETPTADSEPGTCEVTSADLDTADDMLEFLNLTSWSCSRPVWDDDRCVWHADATNKPPEELAATTGDGEPHGAQLSGVDLSEGSVLSGTRLVGADLSGANLGGADLSGANLTGAGLRGADLPGADLREVRLADVSLSRDTTVAGYRDRALSEEVDDQETRSGGRYLPSLPQYSPSVYDRIARIEHELRTAYSNNGLTRRGPDRPSSRA